MDKEAEGNAEEAKAEEAKAEEAKAEEAKADIPFEERKWNDEVQLRTREIEIRNREVEATIRAQQQSRWTSPLVIAVLGAALAGLGNLAVAWKSGQDQLALTAAKNGEEKTIEQSKAEEEKTIEESKAESARILEAVKASDPDRAAQNLSFLLDAGLITDEDRRKKLAEYLTTRKGGQGVNIETAAITTAPLPPNDIPPPPTEPEAPQQQPAQPAQPPQPTLEAQPNSPKPIFTFTTAWIGGGHNQSEACSQGIAKLREEHPGENFKMISSDEESRKDVFGHVTYKYTCVIGQI